MADDELPVIESNERLQMGQKGDITVNAGIYKGHYPSLVQDLSGEVVGLAHPFLKGALLPAYRDMNFTFTLEDGTALYVYDMSVRRVDTQENPPILWANIIGTPKRIQRRSFLRVSCFWDILIFHVDNETTHPMTSSWVPAKAIDISIGGYRFVLDDDMAGDLSFESGDRVLLRFELAAKEQIQTGRASRIIHKDSKWEVGVGFDSLPLSTEKKLFEYIRQQEILHREQK